MNIGILGTGAVGSRLTKLFSKANYKVLLGTRNAKTKDLVSELGASSAMPYASAIKGADIVVLSVPYSSVSGVLAEARDTLDGKVVIDCTNPLTPQWLPLELSEGKSAGENIQAMLPRSFVVKALNTIFADTMIRSAKDSGPSAADHQNSHGLPELTCFVASDYPEAKAKVLSIVQDLGFSGLDAGRLDSARYLEAMAHLNIRLALELGGGTNAGFRYHRLP